jgi:hypothetical protein
VPENPVAEETVREEHGTDQDIEDGEKGDQDSNSASQKITGDEDRKIIEVEDERDFLDKIGPEESHNEDDGHEDFLKMFHDELFNTLHDLSPV